MKSATAILGLIILWVAHSIVFGQVAVYDLADDWSDTNNRVKILFLMLLFASGGLGIGSRLDPIGWIC